MKRSLLLLLLSAVVAMLLATLVSGMPSPAGVHPIVWASGGVLLGGSIDGKWVDDKAMSRLVKGGERYHLYTLTGKLGEAAGGKPEFEEQSRTFYVHVKPEPRPESDVIGVCGDWEALPRKPKIMATKQKVYQDAVRSLLTQKGLASAPVNITQILRVDLEGDGVEEVLVSATHPRSDYLSFSNEKNDYSFVMLRKIVKGKVETIVLEGEFYPKKGETTPNRHLVCGVLDLNGDGKLEVLVRWQYYEGRGVDVYTVQGKTKELVLSGGYGA